MNQRPLVLLYPAAALGLAAVIYAAIRTRSQLAALRADLKNQHQRILDLEQYLRPLRDYSKNRPNLTQQKGSKTPLPKPRQIKGRIIEIRP